MRNGKLSQLLRQSKQIVMCISALLIIIYNNSLSAQPNISHKGNMVLAKQVKQYQDLNVLKQEVSRYLTLQTAGYPGEVALRVGNIDRNLKLPVCHDVNVDMPNGRKAWGKTSVSVSCTSPRWRIYVQAQVKVMADYLVTAMPLAQGQLLSESDVMLQKGDLAQLPAGIFTMPEQVKGKMVGRSMIAGTILRTDMLKLSPVIQQGQAVMLVTEGKGFSISAEGKAISKATEGQVVQVKVSSGQVISGIARQSGRVEVIF